MRKVRFTATAGAAVIVMLFSWSGLHAGASGNAITGCVGIGTGSVRIVPDASGCLPVESALTWDQQGPPGLANVHTIYSNVVVSTGGTLFTLPCPSPETALSGGYGFDFGGSEYLSMTSSDATTLGGVPTGWRFVITNRLATKLTATIQVTCATTS